MDRPLVSVLVLTRNSERFIRLCLNSIFQMSYKDIEVILVDSKSSDGTLSIAAEFPVKIVRLSRASISDAYNFGIAEAKGKYVFIVNGDSIVSREFLTHAVEILESNPEVGIVGGTRRQCITGIISKLYRARFLRDKVKGNIRKVSGNYIFRRDVYMDLIGKLDESYSCQEWYVCKRFRDAGFKLSRILIESMYHLDDNDNSILNYWKKHLWYAKGKAWFLVNNGSADLDIVASFLLYFIILLASIVHLPLIYLLAPPWTVFIYYFTYNRKYFRLYDSVVLSLIDTFSTIIRAIMIVPYSINFSGRKCFIRFWKYLI